MGDLRRAVGVPNLGDYADPHRLIELAVETERAGWDGFFLWDALVHEPEAAVADPQVVLGAIAAATERIRIGVLLIPLARRRPWKVARESVTLDHLSAGRLVFGAALGWSGEHEFAAFGEPADARVRADRLDEALTVIDRLWSGERVRFEGEHHRVDGVRFEPRPLQRPRIPVWIGGAWPNRRPFRRAARWDGVFPLHRDVPEEGTMSPDQLREILAYVAQHRPPGLVAIDAIVEGNSEGDRAPLEDYRAAGLTWYIEKLGWWRGDVAHTRACIRRGPPAM